MPFSPLSLETPSPVPFSLELSEEDKIFFDLEQKDSLAYRIFNTLKDQVKKDFQPLEKLAQKSIEKIEAPSAYNQFNRQLLTLVNLVWKALSLYRDFSLFLRLCEQPPFFFPRCWVRRVQAPLTSFLRGIERDWRSDDLFNGFLQSSVFRVFSVVKTSLELQQEPLFVRSHLLASKDLPHRYATAYSVIRVATQLFFNSFYLAPLKNTLMWQKGAGGICGLLMAGGKWLQELQIHQLYLQIFEKHLQRALKSSEYQSPTHQKILQVIGKVNRENHKLNAAYLFSKHLNI